MAQPEVLGRDKWDELYSKQLSYSINLILGMATGAIGFCISQMIYNGTNMGLIWALKITVGLLMLSIFSGVLCTGVRLLIFYKRRNDEKYELNKAVMLLVIIQFSTFFCGDEAVVRALTTPLIFRWLRKYWRTSKNTASTGRANQIRGLGFERLERAPWDNWGSSI